MIQESLSIVIPCYNDAAYVEEAVQSALQQTYGPSEIIMVDDGSDLATKEVLHGLKPLIHQLITQENQGQSCARNRGIQEAGGKYILTLDSDDKFDPGFCEKALAIFQKDPNVCLVTCNAELHYSNGHKQIFEPKGGTLKNFLFSNAAIGSSMFRKKDWENVGGYDENMRNGWEDWEFYLRLMKLGGSCQVIPKVLFYYRKRDDTTTATANLNKQKLYQYIFTKHKTLYLEHYDELISFFLEKIEREEKEKLKNRNRLEFKLGHRIIEPLRWIKRKLNEF